MHLQVLCMWLFGALVLGSTDIHVSHVTISVSNLERSLLFYRHLLGGNLVEKISSLEPVQGAEYQELYGDKSTDLSVGGTHQVLWAFLLYDNMMVQLIEIRHMRDGRAYSIPPDTQPHKSEPDLVAMLSSPKVAFWLWNSVNLSTYADNLEQEALKLGLQKVRFLKPLLLSDSVEDRQLQTGNETDLRKTLLQGLSIAYATGPDGEMLKFIQLSGASYHAFGRHYCLAEVVSSAFLDDYNVDKCGFFKRLDTANLYGINHISLPTTGNAEAYLKFLTEKLGGVLIDDIQPTGLKSPSLVQLMSNGGAPASTSFMTSKEATNEKQQQMMKMMENAALNLRYVLLRNVMIEISYLTGIPKAMLNTSGRTHKIQAGTVKLHLAVQSKKELEDFLDEVQTESKAITSLVSGQLSGYSYSTIYDLSGQMIRVGTFRGHIRQHIHWSSKEYNTVTSFIEETNPYKKYMYEELCLQSDQVRDEL